jgi:uncharacterized membrane protein YbaN (DUF454 family)
MNRTDYSHHVNKHANPGVRLAYLALGCLCVALGVAGAFLPVLPTTPFMLLAAACFARASTRFYNWLLNTRAFGPAILEWRLHHSIPYRVKIIAIVTMAVTLTASIVLAVEPGWLQGLLAGLGVLLATWMYRIPSRDAPRSPASRS